MTRYAYRFAAAVAIMLAVCGGVVWSDHVAAAPQGVSLSPSLNEIVLGSGLLKSETKLTVTNTTDKPVSVSFSAADMAPDKTGVLVLRDPQDDRTTALARWMDIVPDSAQTLAPGSSVTVLVTITNSPDMAPGGHYGAVIATISGPVASQVGGQVGLKQQLAASFVATKAGNETYQLSLNQLEAAAFRDVPARIELPFRSAGNTHVVPRGTVAIYDGNKRLIAKGIINDGSKVVFPGVDRNIAVDLQRLATLPEHGTFQAVISYRHDKTDQFQTTSITFTRGLPWLGTAIVATASVLIVMLLLVAVLMGRKLYQKRHKKRP